jgi:hypothetical protein
VDVEDNRKESALPIVAALEVIAVLELCSVIEEIAFESLGNV